MQKKQFRSAVPRKFCMPAVSSNIPVATFTAEYTQAGILMRGLVGADDMVAKPVNLQQSGEFPLEQLPSRPQPRQRALVVAIQ